VSVVWFCVCFFVLSSNFFTFHPSYLMISLDP